MSGWRNRPSACSVTGEGGQGAVLFSSTGPSMRDEGLAAIYKRALSGGPLREGAGPLKERAGHNRHYPKRSKGPSPNTRPLQCQYHASSRAASSPPSCARSVHYRHGTTQATRAASQISAPYPPTVHPYPRPVQHPYTPPMCSPVPLLYAPLFPPLYAPLAPFTGPLRGKQARRSGRGSLAKT